MKFLNKHIETVKLLEYEGNLLWKQEPDRLVITCPEQMPFAATIDLR